MARNWKGPEVMKALEQAASRAVFKGAHLVRNEEIRLIQSTPRTGRTYRRGAITHIASSPGNPPATDRGDLIRGIRVDHKGLRAEVVSAAKHSAPLELGTGIMARRPFAVPALNNMRRQINKTFQAEIEKALSGK